MKIEGFENKFLFKGQRGLDDEITNYELEVIDFVPIGLNFIEDGKENFKYSGLSKLKNLDSIFSFPKKGISLHSSDGNFSKFIVFNRLEKGLKIALKNLSQKHFYGGGEESYIQRDNKQLLETIQKIDYKNIDKNLIKSIAEHKAFHGYTIIGESIKKMNNVVS